MSVPPSVCPHGKIRLPLEGFSWNLIFEYLSKTIEKLQVSLKQESNNGCLTWRLLDIFEHISLISSSNEKCFAVVVQEIRTHAVYSIAVFRKSCLLWDNVEKLGRAGQGQRWQYGACALSAAYLMVQTHTHTICNTYCCSTAIMVAGKRPKFQLYVDCLSCLIRERAVQVTIYYQNCWMLLTFVQ